MTLNSHFALNTVFRVESFSVGALVLRHDCFKMDGDACIYCQRQRCSPVSVVSGDISLLDRPVLPRRKCSAVIVLCDDIRVMPIFVGVRWMDRGQQIMSGVVENCHFCFLWSLYLSKVHI